MAGGATPAGGLQDGRQTLPSDRHVRRRVPELALVGRIAMLVLTGQWLRGVRSQIARTSVSWLVGGAEGSCCLCGRTW